MESTWKEPINDLSDIEVVPSPIGSAEDSPYNPEFASPFDIGSPTLMDDDNVDFRAYKDVVAFNDIMKSKVKQHARKQKRRKLEEMKFDLDGRGGSRKEVMAKGSILSSKIYYCVVIDPSPFPLNFRQVISLFPV